MKRKKLGKILLTAIMLTNYLSPLSVFMNQAEAAEYLPSCEEKEHYLYIEFSESMNGSKTVRTADGTEYFANEEDLVTIPLTQNGYYITDAENNNPEGNGLFITRKGNGTISIMQTPSTTEEEVCLPFVGCYTASVPELVRATISFNNGNEIVSLETINSGDHQFDTIPHTGTTVVDEAYIENDHINWRTVTLESYDEAIVTYANTCAYRSIEWTSQEEGDYISGTVDLEVEAEYLPYDINRVRFRYGSVSEYNSCAELYTYPYYGNIADGVRNDNTFTIEDFDTTALDNGEYLFCALMHRAPEESYSEGYQLDNHTDVRLNVLNVESPKQTGYEDREGNEFSCTDGFTNVNGVSVKWEDVANGDTNIKYLRQYSKNGTNWTGAEVYATNETNYRSFGHGEVEHYSRVKSFYDLNNNNQLDEGEPESDWSNVCSITYDATDPVVTINSPIAGTVNGTVDILATIDEINLLRYYLVIMDEDGVVIAGPKTVYKDNGFSNEVLFSWDTTTVEEGEYTIHLAARDKAMNRGEESEDSVNVIVDRMAPATPTGLVRRSLDGTIYECGDVAQRQTLIPDWNDNTESDFDHYEYTSFHPDGHIGLDELVLVDSEMVHSWIPPVDGTYGFAVRAVDTAGNKSAWAIGGTETLEDSCQITYDSIAPEVPELISPKNGAIENGNPVQTWEEISDAEYYVYASYRNEDCTDQIYTTTVNGTSRTVGGKQTINIWWRVKAVDAAGNESDWSDAWNLNIDNTKPEITLELPVNEEYKSGDINLQAICNEECDYINFWWKSEDQEYSNVSPDRRYHYVYENGTEFNWTLNILDAERWGTDESYVMEDGKYFFYAAGKDLAGNWAKTQEVMVIIDNSAPVAVITLPSDGDKVAGIVDIFGYVYDENLSHYNISINPGDADVHDFSLRLEDETVYTDEFDNKFLYSWNTDEYEDGEYQIRLAARDLAGNRELDTDNFDGNSEHVITVTVDNTAPYAELVMSVNGVETNEVNEGQEATFTLENVSEDAVSYVWSFDGIIDEEMTESTATHTWANNSAHTVEVVITDDVENSDIYELEIEVNNVAPSVKEIENIEITLGELINLNAIATDPSFGEDADELSYIWDMGDGNVILGTDVVNYEYTEVDDYTVTLTVNDNNSDRHIDEEDGITTISFEVTVNPVPSVQGASTTEVLGAATSSVLGASTETLASTGSTIAWIVATMGLMLVGGSVYTLRKKNK